MEGHCSTGQSPQWAVVLMEEEMYLCIKHRYTDLYGGLGINIYYWRIKSNF